MVGSVRVGEQEVCSEESGIQPLSVIKMGIWDPGLVSACWCKQVICFVS